MKNSFQYYIPSQLSCWTGRADTPPDSSFFQIVQPLKLSELNFVNNKNCKNTKFSLLGFECDEGVRRNMGRPGAKEGPSSLRTALAKLPIHRDDFEFYDAGNIQCVEKNLEQAQEALGHAVYLLLLNGYTPIVIGGGHEVSWGHYQGIRKFIQDKNLGIVNFDAHLDMRNLLHNDKGSSGTPFLQIALDAQKHNHKFDYHCIGVQKTGNTRQLFETARQFNVKITLADYIHQNDLLECQNNLQEQIDSNDYFYLTLCLDVFGAGYAPGVSAPQPFGLSPWQILPIIEKLIHTKKCLSFDIAELCPKFDNSEITSKLAASFVHKIIHSH